MAYLVLCGGMTLGKLCESQCPPALQECPKNASDQNPRKLNDLSIYVYYVIPLNNVPATAPNPHIYL